MVTFWSVRSGHGMGFMLECMTNHEWMVQNSFSLLSTAHILLLPREFQLPTTLFSRTRPIHFQAFPQNHHSLICDQT